MMLAGLILSLLTPFIDTKALPQAEPAQAGGNPVTVAAGDIACGLTNCRQKYTSDLLVNAGLAAVLDLGDNQYYCGAIRLFYNPMT